MSPDQSRTPCAYTREPCNTVKRQLTERMAELKGD
jgi:hypothetical protein